MKLKTSVSADNLLSNPSRVTKRIEQFNRAYAIKVPIYDKKTGEIFRWGTMFIGTLLSCQRLFPEVPEYYERERY